MARTKRSAKLDSRNARMKLEPGKMHQERMAPGRYLAYRRSKDGVGSWYGRMKLGEKTIQEHLGTSDDYSDTTDGDSILTFAQAQAKAGRWFEAKEAEAKREENGEVVHRGPFTVEKALEDYFGDAQRRGVKGLSRDQHRAALWITPFIGNQEVANLTRTRLEAWQLKIAETPRRIRTKRGAVEQAYAPAPATDDEKRARKDSANRCLTVLKAALNLALDRRKVLNGEAWQSVKPFRETTKARIRFLSQEDQVRLVNASPAGFKDLLRAALLTGARYSELARLQVGDFDNDGGTILIAESKAGKPRRVILTEDGLSLFQGLTSGRDARDLIFLQPGKKRLKRESLGEQWGDADASRYMAQACRDAGIESLTFHELRHSYASMLVNRGVPLAYVAAQLGHSDTRMVEKHYGHLAPSAMANAIRSAIPAFGLVDSPKVTTLNLRQG